jgi:DNA-binding PadR family transcriptional regulator
MTPAEIAQRRELDQEICHYVRELQGSAPIRAQAVERYLTGVRALRVTSSQVQDRLQDLVDRGYLATNREWAPGERYVQYYAATAKARAALDQVEPWDWEVR